MGLDDFKTDDSESSDSSQSGASERTYVKITKEEFEEFLEDLGADIGVIFQSKKPGEAIGVDDNVKEWIYEAYSKKGTKILRIYSSIDTRSGAGRDRGADAIRVVLLEKIALDDGPVTRPLLKEKSTYRIKTWRKNLRKKVENIIHNRKDELKFCDKCGRVMIVQTNREEGNRFWGCSGYYDQDNQCRNTEPLE